MAGRCRCRCRAGVFQRRRSAAHVRRRVYPRQRRGLTEGVTARAVRLCHCCARRSSTLARSGSGSGVVAYLRHADSRGVSSPGTLRSATMSADVGGDGVTRPLARSGWRRCSGARMASVEDEVRRADPLSVNPGQRPGREDEEICTAGRCRCKCSAVVFQRRRSAAHLRRAHAPDAVGG